tara:strand:- start:26 stop:328 length:303 start_codon:yes stop_codon:yes gene_type:complete
MKHIFISQNGDIVSDDTNYLNMFNTLIENEIASVENYTFYYDNKSSIICKVAYLDDQINDNIAVRYFKGPILIECKDHLSNNDINFFNKRVLIAKGKLVI